MNSTESSARLRRIQLTPQEEFFLFASLMLITCFFLPWRATQSPSDFVRAWDLQSGTPQWLFILIVICLTPLSLCLPRIRPWVGLFAAFCVSGALAVTSSTDWGAQLARVFVMAMLILSANPAVVKATDVAMKRLNSQKAEVFNHWGTALHGIQFSAKEFYENVEHEIRARQWPGVEVLRILHTEAGLLSHKREYLRVVRQRQVFDICAATFGKDYFFTMREAEIRAQLTFATLIIFLVALGMVSDVFLSSFGLFAGLINFAVLLVFGIFLLFNVLRMGLTRLDGVLMRLPVLG